MSNIRRSMMAASQSGGSAIDWESVYAQVVSNTITDLVIPDTVTTIRQNAFAYCNNIVTATIPASVTGLSAQVFMHCIKLTSVVFQNPNTELGQGCFDSCAAITDIRNVLPQNVSEVGYNWFIRCNGLIDVVVPEGVTQVVNYAFRFDYNIKTMVFPTTLTKCTGECAPNGATIDYLIFKSTTPPTIALNSSIQPPSKTFPIYVPDASVDAYKTANVWSNYASRIKGISERPTT